MRRAPFPSPPSAAEYRNQAGAFVDLAPSHVIIDLEGNIYSESVAPNVRSAPAQKE
jgi:hypothetical protein